MAAALGVVQSAVAGWLKRGKVPEEHCPAIEFATGGAVTVEDLAPGRLWVRMADADWPHPDGRPMLDYSRAVDCGTVLLTDSTKPAPQALGVHTGIAISSEAIA